MSARPRVTARKHLGDDRASWAVFIDGRPWATGLTKTEVPYYKRQAERVLAEREGRARP
jgi:hypothetical protein